MIHQDRRYKLKRNETRTFTKDMSVKHNFVSRSKNSFKKKIICQQIIRLQTIQTKKKKKKKKRFGIKKPSKVDVPLNKIIILNQTRKALRISSSFSALFSTTTLHNHFTPRTFFSQESEWQHVSSGLQNSSKYPSRF